MEQYGLTPQGPNPKRLDVILDEMHDYMTKRLGVNTRTNPQSLLNHLLTNIGDRLAELWEYGTDVYYSQYPYSAEHNDLDNAAQYGGSTRELPAKSYYRILCTGIDGTEIPAGTLITSDTNPAIPLTLPEKASITRSAFNQAVIIMADPEPSTALGIALNGTLYNITPSPEKSVNELLTELGDTITDDAFTVSVTGDEMTIASKDEVCNHIMVLSESLTTKTVGSILSFATVEDGDILIPPGVITRIVKSVSGLQSIVNVGSYIAGRLLETDEDFRKSYADKIYNRSSSMLESVKSAILMNVQGVKSIAGYENDTNVVDAWGRWPHSIEMVVDGGDTTEIAKQIFKTKAGGISSFGDVATTLHGVYGEDIVIRFNRPTYVKVWFRVGVILNPNIHPPTNYVELIKAQIMEKMEDLDAGESVVPQKFCLDVCGIDYIDIWLYASTDGGAQPDEYNHRSISITARQKAVTSEDRIEVHIDG